MTTLPPDLEALMPEPEFRLKWIEPLAAYRVSKPNIGDADCYTATQMREAILAATERAAKVLEALRDDHCKGTRMSPDKHDWCEPDDVACEFVTAWNEGAAAIRGAEKEGAKGS
jgi:hypothetical protein